MKKKNLLPANGRIGQLALTSAMALLAGAANADITAGQAQAMAADGVNKTAQFLVGVLGGCASTYPEMRDDVVKVLQTMRDDLQAEEANKIISSVGRCMSKESVPTKSQCNDLAAQVPSRSFDPNDKKFEPLFMTSLDMLAPCRGGK
ncbi:hypothetical protein H7F36_03440 [Variovorax sp. PAMC28562]|uniref:hypothetical protein n=1 Tax=Variovorax sp. PAMC28562 TaxID=2762323 RepID=UPI00164E696C|nr:hypothetical protein [Variovorax sp. PAMC28562]QNK74308.1 hypothetical protein H7F36_03440 [Variovorax sp. PAMC28562]